MLFFEKERFFRFLGGCLVSGATYKEEEQYLSPSIQVGLLRPEPVEQRDSVLAATGADFANGIRTVFDAGRAVLQHLPVAHRAAGLS